MGAQNKAQLKAQALELGYLVDDSLTKRELADLVAQGPAAPATEVGELEPSQEEAAVYARAEELGVDLTGIDSLEALEDAVAEREDAIANPEGTPETPATEWADEPGAHDPLDPDLTVDDDASDEERATAAALAAQSGEGVAGALKERLLEVVQPKNLRQFGRYASSKYARPRL